jgi:hypothetical protein
MITVPGAKPTGTNDWVLVLDMVGPRPQNQNALVLGFQDGQIVKFHPNITMTVFTRKLSCAPPDGGRHLGSQKLRTEFTMKFMCRSDTNVPQ